jgi:hypothetical protein
LVPQISSQVADNALNKLVSEFQGQLSLLGTVTAAEFVERFPLLLCFPRSSVGSDWLYVYRTKFKVSERTGPGTFVDRPDLVVIKRGMGGHKAASIAERLYTGAVAYGTASVSVAGSKGKTKKVPNPNRPDIPSSQYDSDNVVVSKAYKAADMGLLVQGSNGFEKALFFATGDIRFEDWCYRASTKWVAVAGDAKAAATALGLKKSAGITEYGIMPLAAFDGMQALFRDCKLANCNLPPPVWLHQIRVIVEPHAGVINALYDSVLVLSLPPPTSVRLEMKPLNDNKN